MAADDKLVIDGVELPAVPDKYAEAAPYAAVVKVTGDTIAYLLVQTTAPTCYVPKELTGGEGVYGFLQLNIGEIYITYDLDSEGNWNYYGGVEITSDALMDLPIVNGTIDVVWANYVIYIATAVNDDGTYTVGEETFFAYVDLTYNGPDRVAVDGLWVAGIADFCRSLTGRKQKFTVDDITNIVDSGNYAWQAEMSGLYGDVLYLSNTAPTINAVEIDPWPLCWSYSSYTTRIHAPNAVRVGMYAFAINPYLSSFVAPELEVVDFCAFNGSGLTSLDYPKMKRIGQEAFVGCGVAAIDFPLLEYVGDGAFKNCTKLTTVVLPSTLTKIGKNPFRGCTALTSITVDSANETYCAVDNSLYTKDVKSLISVPGSLTEYTVIDGVTTIGDWAFYGQSALASVVLPGGLVTIGEEAFRACSALTAIDLPDSLVALGERTFYNCRKLAQIGIPVNVSELPAYCFYGCSALTAIELPSATSIGTGALQTCSAITTIDLAVATSIAAGAFANCYSLTAVILRSETVCTVANVNAFSNCYHFTGTTHTLYNPDGLLDGYIYVPSSVIDSYKADSVYSAFAERFRALEDYTADGTITGELDESKV